MLITPKEAYTRLVAENRMGMDDPQCGYPVRWYFNDVGILCSCPWRSPCPTQYPEFKRPMAAVATR